MSNTESSVGHQPPVPTDDAPASVRNPLAGRPRVWTAFVAAFIAFFFSVVSQGIVAGVLVARLLADGVDPKELGDRLIPLLMSPPAFIGMLVLGQFTLFATAVVAAKLSPVPTAGRLGLAELRCPAWTLVVFVLGTALPLAASVGAAHLVAQFIDPDASVEMLYEQMTVAWAIPFIILIGLLPGISEELLFRGYIQRRFVDRWGPGMGIAVTSIIFGLFHVTPHGIALATIMGVWLGILAYRTGSVVPGMLCHAAANSGWNVWQVGKGLWGMPETPSTAVSVIGVTLMVLCFALAIWVLATKTTEPDAALTEA